MFGHFTTLCMKALMRNVVITPRTQHHQHQHSFIYLFILSLFYFGRNYTIAIEMKILFTMFYGIKIKISHDISRIYLQRRPIHTMLIGTAWAVLYHKHAADFFKQSIELLVFS